MLRLLFPAFSDAVEMTDSASETEVDEETALSDQDSVSLLHDLPAFRSGSGANALAVTFEVTNNQQKGDQKSASGSEASSSRSGELWKKKTLHTACLRSFR